MDFSSEYKYDHDDTIKDGNEYRDKHKKTKQEKITSLFIKMPFNLITDPDWRKENRSELNTYFYIAHKAIRKPTSYDEYDLYNRYCLNNKIASIAPVREIAKAFSYKETGMIRTWIKKLEKRGAFIIEKIDIGQPELLNVYVIGEFQARREILYYGNFRGS